MPDRPPSSLLQAFRYAFAGLALLLRTQRNARIHLGITLLVVALGLWLRLETMAWAVLVLAAGLVWSAEAINSALESLVDLTSPDIRPAAQAAKDMAAGAVLLAASASLVIGILVLGPPLLARWGLL